MNKKYSAIFVLIALLFSGCASVPAQFTDIQISSEADPVVIFKAYQTYAWVASSEIENDTMEKWATASSEEANTDIKFLINQELSKRGMFETDIAPDIYVAYTLGVNVDAMELKVDPETQMSLIEHVPHNGLVIVMVDRLSKYLVWIGVAEAEPHEKITIEARNARLNYAVTEMLDLIPY